MDLQSTIVGLITGLILFSITRFFQSKDKTDGRTEKLEDKGIQDLKTNFDERFSKFEKNFQSHVNSTDKSFDGIEQSNKEINTALTQLKISYEKVNEKMDSNAKLSEQKFETIKGGLEELKKTVQAITQVTVKPIRNPKAID